MDPLLTTGIIIITFSYVYAASTNIDLYHKFNQIKKTVDNNTEELKKEMHGLAFKGKILDLEESYNEQVKEVEDEINYILNVAKNDELSSYANLKLDLLLAVKERTSIADKMRVKFIKICKSYDELESSKIWSDKIINEHSEFFTDIANKVKALDVISGMSAVFDELERALEIASKLDQEASANQEPKVADEQEREVRAGNTEEIESTLVNEEAVVEEEAKEEEITEKVNLEEIIAHSKEDDSIEVVGNEEVMLLTEAHQEEEQPKEEANDPIINFPSYSENSECEKQEITPEEDPELDVQS